MSNVTDVSSFMGGNFFSQLDLTQPIQLMTIGKTDRQLVGQGQQAEEKICVTFNEFPSKALALNKTNLKRVAALYSVNATAWAGQQLQVYRSTTTFQNASKLCVRVCGPQEVPPDPVCDQQGAPVLYQSPAAAPAPAPAPQPVAVQPVQPPVSAPQPQQPAAQPQEQSAQQTPWTGE